MSAVYSIVGAVVFVALLVSAYKFFRWRTNFARVMFWGCAVVLAALVYADDRLSITQPALQRSPTALTDDETQSLAATFKETENELLKFREVDAVYFSTNYNTCALEIKLVVNDLAGEKFLREIEDETIRTFLHAAVDNWYSPSTLIGGGV